jgi:hypothetical protein
VTRDSTQPESGERDQIEPPTAFMAEKFWDDWRSENANSNMRNVGDVVQK